MGKAPIAIVLSIITFIVTVGTFVWKREKALGIDFTGGTRISCQLGEKVVTETEINQVLSDPATLEAALRPTGAIANHRPADDHPLRQPGRAADHRATPQGRAGAGRQGNRQERQGGLSDQDGPGGSLRHARFASSSRPR